MSNAVDPNTPRTVDASLPLADIVALPWAVKRIRNQLYWQVGYSLFRALVGLLVAGLAAEGRSRLGMALGVTVFVLGLAVATASFVLARKVTTRRRSVRMVIIGLQAVLCAAYALPTLRAIVGLFTGGGLVGVVPNALGLLIAVNVLRHACGSSARDWFNAP